MSEFFGSLLEFVRLLLSDLTSSRESGFSWTCGKNYNREKINDRTNRESILEGSFTEPMIERIRASSRKKRTPKEAQIKRIE